MSGTLMRDGETDAETLNGVHCAVDGVILAGKRLGSQNWYTHIQPVLKPEPTQDQVHKTLSLNLHLLQTIHMTYQDMDNMAEINMPRTSFLQRMIEVEIEGVDDMRRHQSDSHHGVEQFRFANKPNNVPMLGGSPINQQHRYENEYWHFVRPVRAGVELDPELVLHCEFTESEKQPQPQQEGLSQDQQHATLVICHSISSSSSSSSLSSSFSSSSSIASTLSYPNAHTTPLSACHTETPDLSHHSVPSSSSILEERIQSIRTSLSQDQLDSSDRKQMWEHLSRLEAAKSRRDELVRRRTMPTP